MRESTVALARRHLAQHQRLDEVVDVDVPLVEAVAQHPVGSHDGAVLGVDAALWAHPGRPLILTYLAPGPLRAAMSQRSSTEVPCRRIACIPGPVVTCGVLAPCHEGRRQRARGRDLLDERLEDALPEPPVPAVLRIVPAEAAGVVAAVEREGPGSVQDRVVRHVALLLVGREDELAGHVVVAAARADLDRRPHRLQRRDGGDRGGPLPDFLQVRGGIPDRHRVDVDAVDVGDAGVRRKVRRGALRSLDRHPELARVERRLAVTPARGRRVR